jgi:hypothetical protein
METFLHRAPGRFMSEVWGTANGGVISCRGADCRLSMPVVGTVASGWPILLIRDKIATPSGHDWR